MEWKDDHLIHVDPHISDNNKFLDLIQKIGSLWKVVLQASYIISKKWVDLKRLAILDRRIVVCCPQVAELGLDKEHKQTRRNLIYLTNADAYIEEVRERGVDMNMNEGAPKISSPNVENFTKTPML